MARARRALTDQPAAGAAATARLLEVVHHVTVAASNLAQLTTAKDLTGVVARVGVLLCLSWLHKTYDAACYVPCSACGAEMALAKDGDDHPEEHGALDCTSLKHKCSLASLCFDQSQYGSATGPRDQRHECAT